MSTQKQRLPGKSPRLTKLKRSKLHQKLIPSEVGVAGEEGLIAWDRATGSHGQNWQLPKLWDGAGRREAGWESYPPEEKGWRKALALKCCKVLSEPQVKAQNSVRYASVYFSVCTCIYIFFSLKKKCMIGQTLQVST